MGFLNRLFQRGETADEALLAVARERGWPACSRSGMAMLPPSHAAADVHGLGQSGAPLCAGRSFELVLGVQQRAATISHLQITVSDEQEHVYDMVTWLRPGGTLLRFEAELGERAGLHHRLADRFRPEGFAAHPASGGAVLRIGRGADEGQAQVWRAAAGWAALMQLAQDPAVRGCVVEGVGDRVAVYSWIGLPRKGAARWVGLVAVAEALDALIDHCTPAA